MTESLTRDCPLAESRTETHTLSRYSKDGWLIKQCSETGFVYLENPPVYEAFEEDFAWEKTIEDERQRRREAEPIVSVLSSAGKGLRKLLRQRKHRMVVRAVKILRNLHAKRSDAGEPLRFVDIGCSHGSILAETTEILLKQYGIQVLPYGIEISKSLANQASGKLKPFSGEVVQSDAIGGLESYEDSLFDYAIMCAFLEHEINPMPLLRMCYRKLRSGGLATIKVPNFGSLNRKIRQDKWCGFRYPDHVNYFTPKSLKTMIEACGFHIAKMGLLDRMPTSDNMWCLVRKV